MKNVDQGWQAMPGRSPEAGDGLEFWYSELRDDPSWDDFLISHPHGQFQQSSAWGRVKSGEGWSIARVLCTRAGELVSGVQVFWRSRYGLRLGYAMKGPVVTDAAGAAGSSGPLVKMTASRLRLLLLLVQSPDGADGQNTALGAAGLIPYWKNNVATATILVDLRGPLEGSFSSSVRKQVARMRREGYTHSLAGAERADDFFRLMEASCRKHKVPPSPSSAHGIRKILAEFHTLQSRNPKAGASLIFASLPDDSGAPEPSGELLIWFGKRMTPWKKGNQEGPKSNNCSKLLACEAMRIGQGLGCVEFDFMGIRRHSAELLLSGDPTAQSSLNSMDQYKLSFGGTPALLPFPLLWIPFWPLRKLAELLGRKRAVREPSHE